jgi:hypothetical protein
VGIDLDPPVVRQGSVRMQSATANNIVLLKGSSLLDKRLAKVIGASAHFASLLASVYFLREQARDLPDAKANRSVDLVFRFYERLSKLPFLRLRTAIKSGGPILKTNHRKFTDEDLESYLGILDSLMTYI